MRSAVTRVGETITFSALTVIAALLSLLVATFQIYPQLGIPLAMGIGTMLLASLTLLPALLAVFGQAAFWPSKTGAGKAGLWGRVATRIVRRPVVPLTIGVLVFGALAAAVTAYEPGGFGGTITAPAGTDWGTPARSRRSRPRARPACRWPSTFYDISSISDSDLARVVPVAIVVIGLLLCLVIRSLIAPLYLIASVALSFFAALGLSVILFIKIGGDSGLTFIGSGRSQAAPTARAVRTAPVALAARAGKVPSRTPNPPRHVPANQR